MTVQELRDLLSDHRGDLDVVLRIGRGHEEKRYNIKPDTDELDSWEQGYETRLFLEIIKV